MSINAAVQCHHKLNSVETKKYVPFAFYLIVWKKKLSPIFLLCCHLIQYKICSFFLSLFSCIVVNPKYQLIKIMVTRINSDDTLLLCAQDANNCLHAQWRCGWSDSNCGIWSAVWKRGPNPGLVSWFWPLWCSTDSSKDWFKAETVEIVEFKIVKVSHEVISLPFFICK